MLICDWLLTGVICPQSNQRVFTRLPASGTQTLLLRLSKENGALATWPSVLYNQHPFSTLSDYTELVACKALIKGKWGWGGGGGCIGRSSTTGLY